MGTCSLLQGMFLTQELNQGLLHYRQSLYHLSYQGSHKGTSVQFSCLVVSNSLRPMNRSMPGLPVHHQLPEFIQTHVHWVSDANQPSHPLSSPCLPDFNLSQHQGLFKWVSSSQQVAKVLEFQFQHQSIQWIFKVNFLSDWLVWSPCNPGDS